jgi:hypothetical protein
MAKINNISQPEPIPGEIISSVAYQGIMYSNGCQSAISANESGLCGFRQLVAMRP